MVGVTEYLILLLQEGQTLVPPPLEFVVVPNRCPHLHTISFLSAIVIPPKNSWLLRSNQEKYHQYNGYAYEYSYFNNGFLVIPYIVRYAQRLI